MRYQPVAAIIVNYNMPERTDKLAEHILRNEPADLYVIDNGSDLVPPSEYTNVFIKKNVQTTRGFIRGVKEANLKADYFAYWFIITSAAFTGEPCLKKMVNHMERHSHVVAVHPALTAHSTTSWEHMKQIFPTGYRQTWMVDNIAALWRADFYNSHGGFDPKFEYGWGIDLEMCMFARKEGKTIWILEPAAVTKITDIGYIMDRMGMTAEERKELARNNMRSVMEEKYGAGWEKLMYDTKGLWKND